MLPKAAVTITTGSVAKTAQICDLIGLGGQSPSQVSLASAPYGGSRGEAILCPFQLLEAAAFLGRGGWRGRGVPGGRSRRCRGPEVQSGRPRRPRWRDWTLA